MRDGCPAFSFFLENIQLTKMEKGNIVIQIDILLSEDQITQEFMDALKRLDLPEKFFYWFPLSIKAWINLCSNGAYRNYVRSHSVLHNHASEIVSMLPPEPIELISLGAGQGLKIC
jgi:hypothetical protein